MTYWMKTHIEENDKAFCGTFGYDLDLIDLDKEGNELYFIDCKKCRKKIWRIL